MSSTNRGYDRHATDYYVTPPDAVKVFLQHWFSDLQGEYCDDTLGVADRPDRIRWLDPCAGGDDKHEMSYASVIQKSFEPNVLTTIDVRQDSKAEIKQDYLWWEAPKGVDAPQVIITNPPFYLAKEIITKALNDVAEGGYVAMLLRLNFFGSNERFPFWERQLPVWTYVHHRRFSFTDDGKTDSIEYMHAVWKKDFSPDFTMLKVI